MEIAKPTEADKERFRSRFAALPGADIKPMFARARAIRRPGLA
jgi:hypothetical protein